jgi:hypothetical protein
MEVAGVLAEFLFVGEVDDHRDIRMIERRVDLSCGVYRNGDGKHSCCFDFKTDSECPIPTVLNESPVNSSESKIANPKALRQILARDLACI